MYDDLDADPGGDVPLDEGYGLQLDMFSQDGGLYLGAQELEFENSGADAREWVLGGRRFLGENLVRLYLAGELRYGEGLEYPSGIESDNYMGWGAGGGVFVDLGNGIYLDGSLMYRGLFDDIEVGAAQADLSGLVGMVGVGIRF